MLFKKHIISRSKAKSLLCNDCSKFIIIDGVKIHYRDEGDKTLEPLLLIHGFATSLHNWDLVTEHLKKTNRVIRLDVPGFGLSTTQKDMDIPKMVTLTHTFLKALNISKTNIVGSSMGGWIAWEFALSYPSYVNKLVLMNAAGFFDLVKAPTHIIAKREGLFNFLAKRGVPKMAIKMMLKNATGGDKSISKSKFADKMYKLINIQGNLKNIQMYAAKKIEPSISEISNIKHDTLIVWGNKDKVVPLACGKRFHKEIKNSELIVYKGVGHIPMLEVPQKVISDLTAFLS